MILYFLVDLLLSRFTTSITVLIYILNIKSHKIFKILLISLLYDLIFTSILFLHFILFYFLDLIYKYIKFKNHYLKYFIILILYKILLYVILLTYNYISFDINLFFSGIFLYLILNFLSYFLINNIKLHRW